MHSVFSACAVRKLEISVQLKQDCHLPAYKGSMWHGWMGRALHKHHPELYQLLYEGPEGELSRPYALDLSSNGSEEGKLGDTITLGITLFGQAADHHLSLMKALQQGLALGLGEERASALWVGHQQLFPAPGQEANLLAWLQRHPHQPVEAATLLLRSPLRLKSQGRVLRSGKYITSDLLLRQIRRRMKCLATCWGPAGQELINEVNQWPLPEVVIESISVQYEDWQRYSIKQQEYLPFGGLKGYLRLAHCPEQALIWLQLGELLQIGGKTTFGLGNYRLLLG